MGCIPTYCVERWFCYSHQPHSPTVKTDRLWTSQSLRTKARVQATSPSPKRARPGTGTQLRTEARSAGRAAAGGTELGGEPFCFSRPSPLWTTVAPRNGKSKQQTQTSRRNTDTLLSSTYLLEVLDPTSRQESGRQAAGRVALAPPLFKLVIWLNSPGQSMLVRSVVLNQYGEYHRCSLQCEGRGQTINHRANRPRSTNVTDGHPRMPPSAFLYLALLVPKVWFGRPASSTSTSTLTSAVAVDLVSPDSYSTCCPLTVSYNYQYQLLSSHRTRTVTETKTRHIPMLGKLSQGHICPSRSCATKYHLPSRACSARLRPPCPHSIFILV